MTDLTLPLSLIRSSDEPNWKAVLDATLRVFDCTTGTLHFWNSDRGALLVEAHRGIPDFLLPKMAEIPIGKGMAGIAAERRMPVQVCNLQTDESGVARPSARDTQVEGSLSAPLLRDGRLYGTIGIAKPVPYEFSEEETEALMRLGTAICERLHDAAPV